MKMKQVTRESLSAKEKILPKIKDKILESLPEVAVTELPSKFIAYPEGSTIKYRPYTHGEIKKFNSSMMSPIDNIEFVLKGIETSFDKKELTVPDYAYLGLMRKILTYGGSKFNLSYQCSSCKEANTEVIDAETLEFQEIQVPELPANLKVEEDVLQFTPIRIIDYIWLIENKKVDDEIAMLAKQCRNKEFKEVYDILYGLSFEEGTFVDKMDQMFFHDVKPLKLKCKKCSSENEVEVEGGKTLVYPFRGERAGATENILYFGVQTPHKST